MDKKLFTKLGQRLSQRAAGAEKLRAVEGILKLDAVVATITKVVHHHFAKMAEAQHNPTDALAAEQFELMREKRFARDGQQHLGNFFRQRTQPRGQTASENGDGNIEW